MPNWVFNGLTIEGNPSEINDLVAQVGKPFTLAQEVHDMGDINAHGFPTKIVQVKYNNPVFAFHNIYSYLDAGITDEEYAQQPMRSELSPNDPKWWEDTMRLQEIDKSWYSWNTHNWGVKWDVAVSDDNKYPDTYMEGPTENGNNLVVYYNFNTPWSIPNEALNKLSSQYPTLLFTLSYEEETGWGGEREYLRGECISESEYGWQCRECDHTEEDTPYCEDCDFDMCPKCGYGEPDDENRATCQTHGVQSESIEGAAV